VWRLTVQCLDRSTRLNYRAFFTAALGKAFECSVVGVEPASVMLNVAMSQSEPNVEWKQGQAENIPLENQAVDLVFMSQVFHHLVQPQQALREINRVLTPAGYLAIRNGTREYNKELAWLRFFPEALEIEDKRTPFQQELKESVCGQSFELISQRIIYQLFAASYAEYFEKVSQRGLSALIVISNEAFQSGLQRFQNWVSRQPRNLPVYEPVDLFVFQKRAAREELNAFGKALPNGMQRTRTQQASCQLRFVRAADARRWAAIGLHNTVNQKEK